MEVSGEKLNKCNKNESTSSRVDSWYSLTSMTRLFMATSRVWFVSKNENLVESFRPALDARLVVVVVGNEKERSKLTKLLSKYKDRFPFSNLHVCFRSQWSREWYDTNHTWFCMPISGFRKPGISWKIGWFCDWLKIQPEKETHDVRRRGFKVHNQGNIIWQLVAT